MRLYRPYYALICDKIQSVYSETLYGNKRSKKQCKLFQHFLESFRLWIWTYSCNAWPTLNSTWRRSKRNQTDQIEMDVFGIWFYFIHHRTPRVAYFENKQLIHENLSENLSEYIKIINLCTHLCPRNHLQHTIVDWSERYVFDDTCYYNHIVEHHRFQLSISRHWSYRSQSVPNRPLWAFCHHSFYWLSLVISANKLVWSNW